MKSKSKTSKVVAKGNKVVVKDVITLSTTTQKAITSLIGAASLAHGGVNKAYGLVIVILHDAWKLAAEIRVAYVMEAFDRVRMAFKDVEGVWVEKSKDNRDGTRGSEFLRGSVYASIARVMETAFQLVRFAVKEGIATAPKDYAAFRVMVIAMEKSKASKKRERAISALLEENEDMTKREAAKIVDANASESTAKTIGDRLAECPALEASVKRLLDAIDNAPNKGKASKAYASMIDTAFASLLATLASKDKGKPAQSTTATLAVLNTANANGSNMRF